jgi:Arc/MetJ-type ribon-helix-helix transcriptional regulator
MTAKPVTVSIDHRKLDVVDGWVRQGRYENRSRALEAALDLLLRRNARPTLEEALAHPRFKPGSPEWQAARRDSEAIDAEADVMNQVGPPAA